MSPEETRQAAREAKIFLVEGVDPNTATNWQDWLCVSDLVAVPVGAVSPSLIDLGDAELVDDSGASFGTLCLTRNLENYLPENLTRWQYVAYLADIRKDDAGQSPSFRHNYVVIDSIFVAKYKNEYMSSAPLWGRFSHDVPPSRLVAARTDKISLIRSILIPTSSHRQSLNRYVEANNAFDRYLKLYHAVELLFDFILLKQMQKMNDDLANFGKIMNNYSNKELDRLKYIIETFCDKPNQIADVLSNISLFSTRAEDIFQNFGKDGNPLKEKNSWDEFLSLTLQGSVNAAGLSASRTIPNRQNGERLIYHIAAYWIYRIRSSIAHSRVGEFLFLESDENFIVAFAEPLLLEVSRQVFASAKLRNVLS